MRDAELSLAIASCRAAFADRSPAAIKQLAAVVSWDRFLQVTARHRVQALCWQGLEPLSDLMSATIAHHLRKQAGAIVESNLRIAAESARLLRLFQASELQLLFLKGLTLDAIAYRAPFLKMGWDIDLLIDARRLTDATELLRSAGYVPVVPPNEVQLEPWHHSHKESVWHQPKYGFHVDLHTRVADNPDLLPRVGIESPSQAVPIAKGIELPTLGREELFAYLSVHGASSAWFRLKWITDLAALLYGQSVDEIEQLYDRSQQLGAGRAAAQALLLAERVYNIEIGDRLQIRLQVDPVNRWLVRVAERQLATIREPTERFLGTAAIHFSQPFLLPGWRFKASEAARQLRDMAAR